MPRKFCFLKQCFWNFPSWKTHFSKCHTLSWSMILPSINTWWDKVYNYMQDGKFLLSSKCSPMWSSKERCCPCGKLWFEKRSTGLSLPVTSVALNLFRLKTLHNNFPEFSTTPCWQPLLYCLSLPQWFSTSVLPQPSETAPLSAAPQDVIAPHPTILDYWV